MVSDLKLPHLFFHLHSEGLPANRWECQVLRVKALFSLGLDGVPLAPSSFPLAAFFISHGSFLSFHRRPVATAQGQRTGRQGLDPARRGWSW